MSRRRALLLSAFALVTAAPAAGQRGFCPQVAELRSAADSLRRATATARQRVAALPDARLFPAPDAIREAPPQREPFRSLVQGEMAVDQQIRQQGPDSYLAQPGGPLDDVLDEVAPLLSCTGACEREVWQRAAARVDRLHAGFRRMRDDRWEQAMAMERDAAEREREFQAAMRNASPTLMTRLVMAVFEVDERRAVQMLTQQGILFWIGTFGNTLLGRTPHPGLATLQLFQAVERADALADLMEQDSEGLPRLLWARENTAYLWPLVERYHYLDEAIARVAVAIRREAERPDGDCGPEPSGNAIDWLTGAREYPGAPNTRITVLCPPNPERTQGGVWGTDVYTDDSAICPAAVHAGRIGFERGGTVTIEFRAGQEEYEGSARNGVPSNRYHRWQRSFVVVR